MKPIYIRIFLAILAFPFLMSIALLISLLIILFYIIFFIPFNVRQYILEQETINLEFKFVFGTFSFYLNVLKDFIKLKKEVNKDFEFEGCMQSAFCSYDKNTKKCNNAFCIRSVNK